MIRTSLVVISVVCVATLLSEVLGLAFLWSRGQLTVDTINDIRLVLVGQDPDRFDLDEEEKEDQLSSKDFVRQRTMRILELSARDEELDLLKTMITDNRKGLIDEQELFEKEKKDFEDELQRLQQANTSTATEQTRGILIALSPSNAVETLLALTVDEDVLLMKGLPEKSIAKILKEFLTGNDEQKERGQAIFKAISHGEPSKMLIDNALQKLAEDAATAAKK